MLTFRIFSSEEPSLHFIPIDVKVLIRIVTSSCIIFLCKKSTYMIEMFSDISTHSCHLNGHQGRIPFVPPTLTNLIPSYLGLFDVVVVIELHVTATSTRDLIPL